MPPMHASGQALPIACPFCGTLAPEYNLLVLHLDELHPCWLQLFFERHEMDAPLAYPVFEHKVAIAELVGQEGEA